MTAMIKDHLQIKVDPALAFDYPTINSLVNYLQTNFVVVTELKEQG
jgi:acyl carrier protein